MNYFYDLPVDIQEIINNNVIEYYRKEHSKLMKDALFCIDMGAIHTALHFKYMWDEVEEQGLDDEFNDVVEIHGSKKAKILWYATSMFAFSEIRDDYVFATDDCPYITEMELKLNIKYEDHFNEDEDVKEFILFIKDNIIQQDKNKEKLLIKTLNAIKNCAAPNIMDTPNPI